MSRRNESIRKENEQLRKMLFDGGVKHECSASRLVDLICDMNGVPRSEESVEMLIKQATYDLQNNPEIQIKQEEITTFRPESQQVSRQEIINPFLTTASLGNWEYYNGMQWNSARGELN